MPRASTAHPGIRRYGLAFFRAIRGEHQELILAEYRMVIELFRAYPDLVYVLNHLLLKEEEKKKVLERVLETCSISRELSSFLFTLMRRRHMDWIEPILEVLQALAEEERNQAIAYVKSAARLSEVQRDRLKQKLEQLTHKKIDLRVEFDPSILGGMVAQVGDRIFDSSLKNKLSLIGEAMARKT